MMRQKITSIIFFSTLMSLICSTFLVALFAKINPNNVSKAKDMGGSEFAFTWIFIILMAVGSLTIYLNGYKRIRENLVFSGLSFLLLPIIIALIAKGFLAVFDLSAVIYLCSILPFVLILVYKFYQFRTKHL